MHCTAGTSSVKLPKPESEATVPLNMTLGSDLCPGTATCSAKMEILTYVSKEKPATASAKVTVQASLLNVAVLSYTSVGCKQNMVGGLSISVPGQ